MKKQGPNLPDSQGDSPKQSENFSKTTPIFVLRVFGKSVGQYRTREAALADKKNLEEDPRLFSEILEREAEDWMVPYFHFEEDKKKNG